MKATLHQPGTLRVTPGLRAIGLFFATCLATASYAGETYSTSTASENHVLRVDVALDEHDFRGGELRLGRIISATTYIDVDDFYLRAVELEASTERDGEVRLKVGRYVTPAVPLPHLDDDAGAMRINAPHRSHKSWRLLFDDQVTIHRLTAILEPRESDLAYYESEYRDRHGYNFYPDFYPEHDYRYSSRTAYGSNSRYRTSNDFWFWIAPTPSFYRLYPSPHHRQTHRRRHRNDFNDHNTEHPAAADRDRTVRHDERLRDDARRELPVRTEGPARRAHATRTPAVTPRVVRPLATQSRAAAARQGDRQRELARQQARTSLAAQQALQAQQRQVRTPAGHSQNTTQRAARNRPSLGQRQAQRSRRANHTTGPQRRSGGAAAGAAPRRVDPIQPR